MQRDRSLTAALVVLLLAACGGPDRNGGAARVSAPPQATVPLVDHGADAASEQESFCTVLTRIVDAERSGFTPVRGGPAGERLWHGELVPPGMRICEIEGEQHPAAAYVCRGQRVAGGSAALLEPAFAAFAARIGACLARPAWYPRNWQRGQAFAFSGGERQIVWRDTAATPKPAIALKIEEDLVRRGYYLRLAVSTMR